MATITRNSMAEAAAKAASEAARVLQARGQEAKTEKAPEPAKVEITEPEHNPRDPRGDPERVKARNPVRAASMESIRAARGEKPPEEAPKVETEPKVDATEPDPTSAAQQSSTPPPVEGTDQPADAAAVAAEPIKTIKVKVDGEEFDAPADEVEEYGGLKAYQIAKASENRLKKANEALAQARQIQEAFTVFAKQHAPAPQPQVSDAQFIASKLDAIRYGTPEEGAAALIEIQQRSTPKIDPNAIINQSVMQMNYQSSVKQFLTEFSDITSKPDLMEWVEVKAKNSMSKLPLDKTHVDWADFWRRIGNEVRNVVGRQPQTASVPQTTGNPSVVSSDREVRKSSIVNLPTAAARATLPEEPKPETREQSLERMKKARGIQIA